MNDTKTEDKKTENHHFNKEKEYDEIVLPLIEFLRVLCVKQDIPFIFGAVVKSDGEGMVIATACQQTSKGWAPTELRLARSMLLGEMMPVDIGKPSDILRRVIERMADHMTEPKNGDS
jgi:hypothetical protein